MIPAGLAGQLACALFGLFQVRGNWQDAVRANKVALEAAFRAQDRPGQAQAYRDLGVAYRWLGRHGQAAAASLEQSLAIFRELGDRQGQAASLNSLGVAYQGCGRYHEAIACQREALTIFQELGNHHGQADALRDLGQALHGAGRHEHAQQAWQQALAIFEALQVPEADQRRSRITTPPPPPEGTASGSPR